MKKLIILYTMLLPFLLSAQTHLPSRTLEVIPHVHRQIAEINNMRLRPCYIGGMPGQDWSEWRTSFYFDDEGRIRKCIRQYSYPEGEGDYIYYFDTTGVAVYSMSRCNSGHDGDVSVCIYRKEDGRACYLDYMEQWGDGSDALIEHTIKNGTHNPIEIDSLSWPSNVEILIAQTVQETTDHFIPSEQWLARFVEPKVGDWAFVSRNKVPVYKKAAEASLIVGYLKVSDDILIRKAIGNWYEIVRPACGYEEHEDHYSGYPEIVGYIRKEFVEPIEKIIRTPSGDGKENASK